MTHGEKRIYLINELLKENKQYADVKIPDGEEEQKILLRSLFNIRMPSKASDSFIKIQNEYLSEAVSLKGIREIEKSDEISDGIYLIKCDITTLECDAIVNAANSRMLGCFCPCHGCIDNAIHTFAGIELRQKCEQIMSKQGHDEPTGRAKITPAYNLPSKYIIHTVGPVVSGRLTKDDCGLLASCYRSCLELAEEYGLKSIAFCCISTGEFHFPNEKAAEIAVTAVNEFKNRTKSKIKVIFNVFKDKDFEIYKRLLGKHN